MKVDGWGEGFGDTGDTDDAKYPAIRVTMYEAAYAIASLSARCEELERIKGTDGVETDAIVRNQSKRITELERWNHEMVEKAASGGVLDGYRELGAKCAELESALESIKQEFERECSDADKILALLPELSRTEGGSLPVAKLINALCDQSARLKNTERELTAFRQPPADVTRKLEEAAYAISEGLEFTEGESAPADVAALVCELRRDAAMNLELPTVSHLHTTGALENRAADAFAPLSVRCAELERINVNHLGAIEVWQREAQSAREALAQRETQIESHQRVMAQIAGELTQAQEDAERLRKLIPGCDCANPSQCWEPCGTLGHSEQHARVVSTTMSVEEFNERKAAIDTARAREGE